MNATINSGAQLLLLLQQEAELLVRELEEEVEVTAIEDPRAE